MASSTQWTWVWVNSRTWWLTGKPDILQSMGLKNVRHDLVTEQHTYVYSFPLEPSSHSPPSFQSTKPSSLCYTAASHKLSILHVVVYICQCYSFNLSSLSPCCVHKYILFICISTSALQIVSAVPLWFLLGFNKRHSPMPSIQYNTEPFFPVLLTWCSSESVSFSCSLPFVRLTPSH